MTRVPPDEAIGPEGAVRPSVVHTTGCTDYP